MKAESSETRFDRAEIAMNAGSAGLLIALLVWIFLNPNVISCDCAAGLEWGQVLLNGSRPYVDYVDLNPPLWGYLDLIPAALAALLHAPPILVFSISIWCLCVLSKLATWHVFKNGIEQTTAASQQPPVRTTDARTMDMYASLQWGSPVILAASIFDLASLNMQGDLLFGQREHIFVLLFLPFFVLRWYRWNGENSVSTLWSIIYGLAAGIGLCLKPHFFLIPVAIELFYVLKSRRLKPLFMPETWCAGVFTTLYTAHFFLVPFIYEQFIRRWLPLLMKGYGYSSFDPMIFFGITFYVKGYPELLFILLLLMAFVGRHCRLLPPTVVFAFAAYIAYALQGKSWTYQAIPMLFAINLSLVLAAWSICKRKVPEKYLPATFLMSTVCVCGALFGALQILYQIWEKPYIGKADPRLAQLIVDKTRPGDPVLFLSTTPGDAYPAIVQLGRKPGSRYIYFFMVDLFAYLREQPSLPAQLQKLLTVNEKLVEEEIASDIETRKPELIFIRAIPQARAHTNTSMLEYVEQSVPIKNALEKNYVEIGRIGNQISYVRRK